jgi:hypothetical protein
MLGVRMGAALLTLSYTNPISSHWQEVNLDYSRYYGRVQ